MQKTRTHNKLEKLIKALEQESMKRIQIEKRLKETETRFNDYADNAFGWIWEIDDSGKYTYSSPAVKKILGYEYKELLGKHFFDYFHPDEKEKLIKSAFDLFSKKESFSKFINWNVDKNGKSVLLSMGGVPIFHQNGNLLGYRGANIDITDGYKTNLALKECGEQLRSLLECASGFAIYRLSCDHNNPYKLYINCVSPSIKELLGIEPENFSSERFLKQIHPDDLNHLREAINSALESNRFDLICRFYNHLKNKWIWIQTISIGVRNSEKDLTHINGILIDITEEQNAIEKNECL